VHQVLLATDLDDTLIGDDTSFRHLNNYLLELISAGHLKLAYVTGRSLHKFILLEKEKRLLSPDALVTAVGTEIYLNEQLVPVWPHVKMWDKQEIISRLIHIHKLVSQPDSEQRPYKVSYFLDNVSVLEEVKRVLLDLNVDILYSHNLYLDILPKNINKGAALKFLAALWNIPKDNIIACGDSANDIDMFSVGNAIIVGNAHKELIEWADKNKSDRIYIAKAKFASGMLEGLQHYERLTTSI
jgi:sucrose-6-phosphatase